MKSSDLLKRVDQLIKQGKEVLSTEQSVPSDMSVFMENPEFGTITCVDKSSAIAFRAASLNFIQNIYDEHNPYYTSFEEHSKGEDPSDIENGIVILESIKKEISGGWLVSVKELVSAEIFSNFLVMGEYLLEQNYKDPAAVIFGSVLEEKIRQLAISNGISIKSEKDGKTIFFKSDRINSELLKANVYNKLDQKHVTAWLDLRNKAAHGKYGEYNIDQVKTMRDGILEFVNRQSQC